MPVGAQQDARRRPAGADAAHEPAQMSANLDARWRLAGTQVTATGRLVSASGMRSATIVLR
jgi:hypothetical protein